MLQIRGFDFYIRNIQNFGHNADQALDSRDM